MRQTSRGLSQSYHTPGRRQADMPKKAASRGGRRGGAPPGHSRDARRTPIPVLFNPEEVPMSADNRLSLMVDGIDTEGDEVEQVLAALADLIEKARVPFVRECLTEAHDD